MLTMKNKFIEKSEEIKKKENEYSKKYINNLNAAIQSIKVIDQIQEFEDRTNDERMDNLSKLREKWLNMLFRELKSYTEFTIEIDKYNTQKQNLIIYKLKHFNKNNK